MITCTRCHVEKDESDFYLSKGGPSRVRRCKACCCEVALRSYNSRTAEQREARKEAHRGYVRAYRARNVEKVRRQARAHHLRKSYGLALSEESAFLSVQGGKCAICRTELQPGSRDLSVDHCHATGRVRGLLCNACNLGLGNFKDNVGSLQRAIGYLVKYDAPARLDDLARTSDLYVQWLIDTLGARQARETNVIESQR